MAKIEVLLPAMGEGIKEAIITRWLKKEGEEVREDEPVAEVATDKVDSEIPAPGSGKVIRLLYKEGETPQVGSVIAIIGSEKDADLKAEDISNEVVSPKGDNLKTFAKVVVNESEEEPPFRPDRTTPSGSFLSPLVRSIAEKEEITVPELESIKGTGKENRITKADLMNFLKNRTVTAQHENPVYQETKPTIVLNETTVKSTAEPEPRKSWGEGVEIVEMDRMRKLIAENMLRSKQVSPHVTTFVEIDVTDLAEWREKVKDSFFTREKEKLTFTPLIVEAAVKALKDFPMVNISVEGTKLLIKKYINIGIATALPSGNLIVPVIKNADQKNLTGLARSVNDLSNRARVNRLVPDDIMGGTFTITNFGTFGNLTGTPIINQPEVAILGAGAIIKKPGVVTTSQGDFIAVRQIMILSLSFDHRVVDGALGGRFLRRLGDYLEQWDINRNI